MAEGASGACLSRHEAKGESLVLSDHHLSVFEGHGHGFVGHTCRRFKVTP